jgi:hypothetical protein
VIKLYAVMSVISFALVVFCVIDIIGTPAQRVRNLPKMAWLVLVLFFPLLGSIAWLAAGRPEKTARAPRAYERELPEYPEYNRPGRAAAVDPAKDEEFLRQVRERAEEQRKRYEASRKPEPPAEPEE